ncbi:MAG: hypothetical protein IIB57_06130, partial [Planctomycetes bacterium]|nr:hypothetical protein [Planctomycetota bacterium]
KENGEIDLEKSYPDNALMARVRSWILPRTNTEPLFPACSDKLTSAKIYERIKDHWDGIKKAPWSDGIKGTLALLKYLLENGEKARFWCKAFENHYGFRLRSRDHDWLVGEIYIGADISPASDTTSIQLVGPAYGDIIARIGDLFIRVGRSED